MDELTRVRSAYEHMVSIAGAEGPARLVIFERCSGRSTRVDHWELTIRIQAKGMPPKEIREMLIADDGAPA